MKTLKLIDQYIKLYEQDDPAAAEVDVNVEEPVAEEPVPEEPPVLTTEAEIYLTKLAALAFSHTPDIEDENMINLLSQEFGETEPKKVTDAIQDILQNSNQSFAAELSEIQ